MHHSESLSLCYHQRILTLVLLKPNHSFLSLEDQSATLQISQSIYQSINQLVNQSIIQSTNHSVSRPINQSINLSINQSINQSTNQSVSKSINRSNKQSINETRNTVFTYLEFISAFIIKMEVLKVCSQQAAFSRIPHK